MKHSVGLIAATFAPYAPDGSVNLALVEPYAERLVADQVRGVFVNGTTGESASLTTDERMRLAERWCAVAGDSLEVIVHVGHAGLEEARAMAAHAEKCGAKAISALSPYFFKPSSMGALVEAMGRVAAAAPNTPFYYYHIPSMTGAHGSMARFLEMAAPRIPTLAGVKYTWEDLMDYAAALEVDPGRFEVFFGRDEILLSALALGASSGVGSTYNLWPSTYLRMAEAFAQGDHATAQAHQRTARRIIQVGLKYGGLPAFKAILAWRGLDCGPTRLPLGPLAAGDEGELRKELEEQGLLEAIKSPIKR
ncbi:MAG: dihydrodipicolinate synthase family protein [Meiothermus sp.]|nr:dihydrodipicolinate synthase family protein [Meiothermus sp.]